MKRPLRVLADAERELDEAFGWYESQRAGLGRELLEAVDAAIAAIANAPEAWGEWPVRPRFRRYLLRRFPYVVFFRVTSDEIRIVAFAHVKRRPGYWGKRR